MIDTRILELRQKLGWSQTHLAKTANVSTRSIKNWESEVSEPSLKNIVQLAQIFSVTTDYLLGLEVVSTIRVDGLSERDRKCLRAMCQIYISNALSKG